MFLVRLLWRLFVEENSLKRDFGIAERSHSPNARQIIHIQRHGQETTVSVPANDFVMSTVNDKNVNFGSKSILTI